MCTEVLFFFCKKRTVTMTNTQSGSSRGVELRSHYGVTLRSGRHIQYESPMVRRHVSPSLEHTPKELLRLTSCNCHGDCSNQRCSCKKNDVKKSSVNCISACRNCKGISYKNCIHDGVESGEDSDLDFWCVWQLELYLNCCIFSSKAKLKKEHLWGVEKWVWPFFSARSDSCAKMLEFNSESWKTLVWLHTRQN